MTVTMSRLGMNEKTWHCIHLFKYSIMTGRFSEMDKAYEVKVGAPDMKECTEFVDYYIFYYYIYYNIYNNKYLCL